MTWYATLWAHQSNSVHGGLRWREERELDTQRFDGTGLAAKDTPLIIPIILLYITGNHKHLIPMVDRTGLILTLQNIRCELG